MVEATGWSRGEITQTMNEGAMFFVEGMHNDFGCVQCPDGCLTPGHVVDLSGTAEEDRPFVGLGGCHGGLVADEDGTANSGDNNVWAWVHKGASGVVGSTALVYGNYDYGNFPCGERWFNDFYLNLQDSVGGRDLFREVGQAWRLASVDFDPGSWWSNTEKRSVVQFVLYGVPWMRPPVSDGAVMAAGVSPRVTGFETMSSRPVALGSESYSQTVTFSISDHDVISDQGYELIEIPGAMQMANENKPVLPKLYGPVLQLPAGSVVTNVKLTQGSTVTLGTRRIPAAQLSTTIDPKPGFKDETDVEGIYPDPIVGYDSATHASYLAVKPFLMPVQHNPQTQETLLWQEATLAVSYQAPAPATLAQLSTDKVEYGTGETIEVVVQIANVSAADIRNALVRATVHDSFGRVLGSAESGSVDVTAGGTRAVTLPVDNVTDSGTHTVRAELLVDGQSVSTADTYVRMLSGRILRLDSPGGVEGWPTVPFEIQYQNLSTKSQQVTGVVEIFDRWGRAIARLESGATAVASGSTGELAVQWDSSGTPAGEYLVLASALADGAGHGPVTAQLRITVIDVYLPIVVR
jgi:hypothetical protein